MAKCEVFHRAVISLTNFGAMTLGSRGSRSSGEEDGVGEGLWVSFGEGEQDGGGDGTGSGRVGV